MSASPRTYLDHNATSPLRPEARDALLDALQAGRAIRPRCTPAAGPRGIGWRRRATAVGGAGRRLAGAAGVHQRRHGGPTAWRSGVRLTSGVHGLLLIGRHRARSGDEQCARATGLPVETWPVGCERRGGAVLAGRAARPLEPAGWPALRRPDAGQQRDRRDPGGGRGRGRRPRRWRLAPRGTRCRRSVRSRSTSTHWAPIPWPCRRISWAARKVLAPWPMRRKAWPCDRACTGGGTGAWASRRHGECGGAPQRSAPRLWRRLRDLPHARRTKPPGATPSPRVFRAIGRKHRRRGRRPPAGHALLWRRPASPSALQVMALDLEGVEVSAGSACSSGKGEAQRRARRHGLRRAWPPAPCAPRAAGTRHEARLGPLRRRVAGGAGAARDVRALRG